MWPAPSGSGPLTRPGARPRSSGDLPALSIDTEADSLHHYPERLCLIQLADPAGRALFLDPLALPDLEPLRPLFADPATLKVFHSGENDVVYLKRRFGFAFAGSRTRCWPPGSSACRELGLDACS